MRTAAVAAVSVRPKTFGTLHVLPPPPTPPALPDPLVLKVSVACPVPIVTVADPAEGVSAEMTVVVPGPPSVGVITIPVTVSPVGTVSMTVTPTPSG